MLTENQKQTIIRTFSEIAAEYIYQQTSSDKRFTVAGIEKINDLSYVCLDQVSQNACAELIKVLKEKYGEDITLLPGNKASTATVVLKPSHIEKIMDIEREKNQKAVAAMTRGRSNSIPTAPASPSLDQHIAQAFKNLRHTPEKGGTSSAASSSQNPTLSEASSSSTIRAFFEARLSPSVASADRGRSDRPTLHRTRSRSLIETLRDRKEHVQPHGQLKP